MWTSRLERYLGDDGYLVGMQSFGASGKAEDVFETFGITSTEVIEMARRALSMCKESA